MRNWIVMLSILFLSCQSETGIEVTENYVYHQEGIQKGFTIQKIIVQSFDSRGIPDDYEEDTLRVDLKFSGTGQILKKIFFRHENVGYYWIYKYMKKHRMIPIDFENQTWYLLWSNEFQTKIKKQRIVFFIYRDDRGVMHIYRKKYGLL